MEEKFKDALVLAERFKHYCEQNANKGYRHHKDGDVMLLIIADLRIKLNELENAIKTQDPS